MADTSSSPFVTSISDLSVDGVMSRDILIESPVDWGIELSRILEDPPLEADMTMTRTRGGLIVRGRVEADVRHTCPRCLTERTESIAVEVAQLVAEQDDIDDADPPDYVLDGDVVDLEPVIRDETLLALPLQPVCPEDCAELVGSDQSDLNTDDPGGESSDSSPFAVLQQLIEHAD
jgi:uncharacterized protein